MKNWKTTTLGIAAILTAISKLATELATGGIASIDFAGFIGVFSTGAGLLFAKDFNVTGVKK